MRYFALGTLSIKRFNKICDFAIHSKKLPQHMMVVLLLWVFCHNYFVLEFFRCAILLTPKGVQVFHYGNQRLRMHILVLFWTFFTRIHAVQDNYTISKLKEKLYNAYFHFDTNSNSHIYNRRFCGLLLCQWKYFGTKSYPATLYYM